MTAGGTMFDRLVAHERGLPDAAAPSLRPRLPYAFQQPSDADADFAGEEIVVPLNPPAQPQPAAAGKKSGAVVAEPNNDHAPRPPTRSVASTEPASTKAPPIEPAEARQARLAVARVAPGPIPAVQQAQPPLPARPELRPETAKRAARFERSNGAAEKRRTDATLLHPPVSRPILPLPSVQKLGGDETRVEIHIGRIDVRALPDQAPPPRAHEPAAQAPDGLAAYLGRRSRGARS